MILSMKRLITYKGRSTCLFVGINTLGYTATSPLHFPFPSCPLPRKLVAGSATSFNSEHEMAKLKRFLRKASFLLATSPSSSFHWSRAFFPSSSHGGPPPARTTRYFSPASKIYMKATSSSRTPSNLLAQVRCNSQVILDTADYLQLAHLPGTVEVTTNPSIVWQAAQKEEYFHLLEEACNVREKG